LAVAKVAVGLWEGELQFWMIDWFSITSSVSNALASCSPVRVTLLGGGHTLNIVIPHMDTFAYAGIFSAGIGGGGAGQASAVADYEMQYAAALQDERLKKSMKLIWFSTGRDDAAMTGTMIAVTLLTKHRLNPVLREIVGCHTL
jgi:hypothetical protein